MKNAAILGVLTFALTIGFGVGPAAAHAGTHECTADLGLGNPVFSAQISPSHPQSGEAIVNAGGCSLHGALDQARTVDSVDPADGCSIQFETADEDNIADGEVQEGQTLDAGTSVSAFCDLGVFDATNAITLT